MNAASKNAENGRIPEYLTLYRRIAEEISEGLYRPGEKLPSKRAAAANTGLSLITVEHAYAMLADEGYIVSKERSGYYVNTPDGRYNPPAGVGTGLPSPEPMRAGALPRDDFPFTSWSRTARQILTRYGIGIFEKSPSRGNGELRNALSRFLGRSRGIICSPDQIVIGSGSEYLYERLIQLLGRNKTFAIESPSYSKIALIYGAGGVKTELLPLGPDGIASEALEKTEADVLHVTPYRSFPSGVTATPAKRREYLKWAGCGDANAISKYIIEDDVESEFTLSKSPSRPLFAMTDRDNVIYMNTFSVTLSPALRISYMVLPGTESARYESISELYSCPVPTFEQLVLASFIESGEFERYINRVRRAGKARRSD